MIALDNTEIRYSILDINLLLLGLYDCKKQVTWGNIMEYMGEGGYAGNKDIRLNNYNYSTVYDMNVLLSGFLQNKLLANEYFDIAYETLTSQYEKSRIPYKLGSKYFTIGHQPGTIITSDFQDVINDCGYIIIDENTYVIINFLCDEVEEDEFIINRAISHISFEALNYYRTLLK